MIESGLNKLSWGFLFIMLSFRVQGFDIFPDIVGFILFALAFNELKEKSEFFKKASKFNFFMIIMSIFLIYQPTNVNGMINYGYTGMFSIPIAIISIVLTLLIIYNLFKGMKEMLKQYEKYDLANEAEERWSKYKALTIAYIFILIVVFIPLINLIYLLGLIILNIIFLVKTIKYINRCKQCLIYN